MGEIDRSSLSTASVTIQSTSLPDRRGAKTVVHLYLRNAVQRWEMHLTEKGYGYSCGKVPCVFFWVAVAYGPEVTWEFHEHTKKTVGSRV